MKNIRKYICKRSKKILKKFQQIMTILSFKCFDLVFEYCAFSFYVPGTFSYVFLRDKYEFCLAQNSQYLSLSVL